MELENWLDVGRQWWEEHEVFLILGVIVRLPKVPLKDIGNLRTRGANLKVKGGKFCLKHRVWDSQESF